MSQTQKAEVEGESGADQKSDPNDVDGLKHGIEVTGIPYHIAEG
ncbi:hypothetical protein [Sinorhizobium meliloti]|nr:hypothetical protein [Sinorhizobium meliloti]